MARKNSKKYRPVVLVILDGLGIPSRQGSTFFEAKRPTFEIFEKYFPFTTLQASSVAVGLPWGEEGNSEVGHLTMGSGRVVYHHLPRIIVSIQDGSFFKNEVFNKAARHVTERNSSIHFVGLFSSGSVHSYVDHLYALLEFARQKSLGKVYLHLFTDGRDAPRSEAGSFLKELKLRLSERYPFAKIASLIGRDFAMDRDSRWAKIEQTYNLLVEGRGNKFKDPTAYLQEQYSQGVTDEFIEPGFLADDSGETEGRIKKGDAVIFFNFREDSARELASSFAKEGFDEFPRQNVEDLVVVTMTEYEPGLTAEAAFPPLNVRWPLARLISEAGLKQLHIAETEKYAHVTYFFNGGIEKPFALEDRVLVPSRVTAHFDEHPEMSAEKITEAVLEGIPKYDFILVNFANADMVGHTGNFAATVKAIEVLDSSVARIMKSVKEAGGVLLVTGDHGNAEEKIYRRSGEKRTKHSTNPVPFYLVGEDFRKTKPRDNNKIYGLYSKVGGLLTDVAPTILELMDLSAPADMTGLSLLSKLGDE